MTLRDSYSFCGIPANFETDTTLITMHTSALTTIAGFAALATAAKIQIAVGKDGLVFTPNTVTAAKGDVIEYQFFPPTHSVIMGDFSNPCMPAKIGGFFSGGFITSNGQNVRVLRHPAQTEDANSAAVRRLPSDYQLDRPHFLLLRLPDTLRIGHVGRH